jgi:hypothetical protein
MEQRTDRRAYKPPENIEEGHVWKSEIRLVENKSLGWIEARRRAETVINNCDAPIRRLPRLLHQKLGRAQIKLPNSSTPLVPQSLALSVHRELAASGLDRLMIKIKTARCKLTFIRGEIKELVTDF